MYSYPPFGVYGIGYHQYILNPSLYAELVVFYQTKSESITETNDGIETIKLQNNGGNTYTLTETYSQLAIQPELHYQWQFGNILLSPFVMAQLASNIPEVVLDLPGNNRTISKEWYVGGGTSIGYQFNPRKRVDLSLSYLKSVSSDISTNPWRGLQVFVSLHL
jgi:hypothetical protein